MGAVDALHPGFVEAALVDERALEIDLRQVRPRHVRAGQARAAHGRVVEVGLAHRTLLEGRFIQAQPRERGAVELRVLQADRGSRGLLV